jgi:CBS domain-containing protein
MPVARWTGGRKGKAMKPTNAGALMTKTVYTASPDDTVSQAAKTMADHDVSALPVCDKDGTLVGMISEGDLLRPFADSNAIRRAWWLSLLAEGDDLAPDFLSFIAREQWPVSKLMTHPVVTTSEATELPAVAELLMTHRIKRVPVLRDGRIVGIVSRADVVRALAGMTAGS